MIPFGMFTRTVLDNGIVRVVFNNVTWTNNNDGTYYYDIPRSTHKSGIYPKTIVANASGKSLTGMSINYLFDGTVRLITTLPLTNFTAYFMGDNAELVAGGNNSTLNFRQQLFSNDDYSSTPAWASAYQHPVTKVWYGAGKKSMFGMGVSDYTNGWEEFSSKLPAPIKDIQFGGACTLALLENGKVYGVGSNGDGRLSDFSSSYFNVWTDLGVSDVIAIATGYAQNIILLGNGTIMTRGRSMWGATGGAAGVGGWTYPQLPDVVTEVKGQWNALYAKAGDVWYAAGYNYGQFGGGSTANNSSFRPIGTITGHKIAKLFPGISGSTYAVDEAGDVYYAGRYLTSTTGSINAFLPVQGIPFGLDIINIESDDHGAVALSSDGRVFMCGGDSNSNSTYTTSEMNIWVEITENIGQQSYVGRSFKGTFIFNGNKLRFSGDNTGQVTGTIGNYSTFGDIPISI